MPLNMPSGNWGTFNPSSYQSAGRGWGGRGVGSAWGRGQGQSYSGYGSLPQLPYGGHGAWSTSGMGGGYPYGGGYSSGGGGYRPSYGRERGGTTSYGAPRKGYRAPSIGIGGGRGREDFSDPYENLQMDKLRKMVEMQGMYGQIYGHDPNFMSAFGTAGAQFMDPRMKTMAFPELGFLNLMGQFDPMSHELASAPTWSHPASSPYYQGG